MQQNNPITLFDGMGCIFKVPRKMQSYFIDKFDKELVFEYPDNILAFKSIESQEPVTCYKKLKEENNYVYFQVPLNYGREFYLKNENLITKHDITFYKKLNDYTSLVKKTPNLHHPRAHKEQPIVFNKLLNKIINKKTAFCNAPTGAGKSILSLKLATTLQTRTLILVHRIKLLKHFEKECLNILGLHPSQLGRIQNGVQNLNAPIVLGTLQSVNSYTKNNPNALKDMFGLVVYDEADIMGAKEFSKCFNKINARYQVGFSATIKRADTMEKVFWTHFGEQNIIKAKGDALPIQVVVQEMPTQLTHIYKSNPKKVNTGLALNEAYNKQMASFVKDAFNKNREILVFAEHVYHLARFKKYLLELGIPKNQIGEYFGSTDSTSMHMTKELRPYVIPAKQKTEQYFKWVEDYPKIVLATYTMMDRGISIARLDLGISLTDRSDMTQAIGRIRRPAEIGKKKPKPVWILSKHKYVKLLTRRTEKIINTLSKDNNIEFRSIHL